MGERASGRAESGLHIVLISVHGLIRGSDLELGRDPDTGGQTLYVVELARALDRCPDVRRVDLVTRRIVDADLDDSYAQPIEVLSEKARILRVDCGPEEYVRKEDLWDHLDSFADNAIPLLQEPGVRADVIHSHYADAGYVASRIAAQFGVPLVHTGHSLGRVKRARLLASGLSRDEIESRYHISQRIDAEEDTLAAASRVIVSTANEIDKQYSLYDHFQPEQMRVVPPGTDLARFHPPDGSEQQQPIYAELCRFLREPQKPFILAISRPDERKNISTLIEAYGSSPELREVANLVVVAGNRDEIGDMEGASGRVMLDILLRIDSNDLYGRIAYPKHHASDDVPVLYRLAAAQKGVFINPALTEPFGLTIIESGASGLPVVATEDGGPRDIIQNCKNGVVVDPLDADAIAQALLGVLSDRDGWEKMAQSGLDGVGKHYSWSAHADRYIADVRELLEATEPRPEPELRRRPMLFHDRALFSDLDQNLLGDPTSIPAFVDVMRKNRQRATFGIATGRKLNSALAMLRRHSIPLPNVLISSVGTEIHYGPEMTLDTAWRRHIDHLWTPRRVRGLLRDLPGLELQDRSEQSWAKLSYHYDPEVGPSPEEITSLLHKNDQTVNMFVSFGQYIDIVPVRASKGFALRWFAEHWGIPLNRILAAGGSGTDEDILRGNTLAVVVGNRHDEELSELGDGDRIYFAKESYALGILEAIDHYDFYGECRDPEAE